MPEYQHISVVLNDQSDIAVFINSLDEFVNLERTLLIIGNQAVDKALETIKTRVVDKKVSAYGTPFHRNRGRDKKFPESAYSDSHTYKRKKQGVQIEKRDYNLTGDMWGSKRVKERSRGADVKVVGGVYGSDSEGKSNEDKLLWNTEVEETKTGAKIMELSDKEIEGVVDFVANKINEAVGRRLKNISK